MPSQSQYKAVSHSIARRLFEGERPVVIAGDCFLLRITLIRYPFDIHIIMVQIYSFKGKGITRKGENRIICIKIYQNYPFGYCQALYSYRILHHQN